jgi:3'-phosphoadenosine 5'-phosphosulfate sulfotransferase (PAPS reductase)/FAD synthetase
LIIHHLGVSGGKDSGAAAGWLYTESGIDPRVIRTSFCDTENEYEETYDTVRRLSEWIVKQGGHPIRWIRSIGFLKLCIKKKRFPGAKSRFCTEHLKMIPSRLYVRELQRFAARKSVEELAPMPQHMRDAYWRNCVIGYTGVRASESVERSKLADEDFSTFYGITIKRPLLDWSISDVWAYHERLGLPVNPLYKQGRYRVGCRLCCMSNKRDVRVTVATRPETIDLYRKWEAIVGAAVAHRISNFFPRKTVPEQFRSLEYTNHKGKTFKVCTIDDVALWAQTLHGGRQFGFDFMHDDFDDGYDQGLSCKSAMGSCE